MKTPLPFVTISALLVSLCTSACQLPHMPGATAKNALLPPTSSTGLLPFQNGAATEPAKLYSRDGGVVSSAKPGSVASTNEPPTGVAVDSGSRMKVIELYQQVVEERDRLRKEVGEYAAALTKSQRIIDDLQGELRQKDGAAGMSSQERDRLLKENADLAGRLATAQIRRLEAEKQLLEHLVDAAGNTGAITDEPATDKAVSEHSDGHADGVPPHGSAEVARSGKHP